MNYYKFKYNDDLRWVSDIIIEIFIFNNMEYLSSNNDLYHTHGGKISKEEFEKTKELYNKTLIIS